MTTTPLADMDRAYQAAAFWALFAAANKRLRRYLLLWLRQGGKTTTLSKQSLRELMKHPGRLVTFVSASLSIGSELGVKMENEFAVLENEVRQWQNRMREMSAIAEGSGMQLVMGELRGAENRKSGDEDLFRELSGELDVPAMCDILTRSRLEVRIKHSRSQYSRMKVIAANIATLRSWTGSVKFDEIAFIRHLDVLLAELEPFTSTNPDFSLVMSTTLPDDYGHYAYELAGAPDDREFEDNPAGHWYRSRAGLWVHRVSIDDAHAAGRKCFHPESGEEQTPDENRETSLNRDGWDRSNRHKRPTVGTSAVSPMAMDAAIERGRAAGIAQAEALPDGWTDLLGDGEITLGFDQASAEGKKANPSAIAVMEKVAGRHRVRAITWWKTASPAVSEAKIDAVVDAIIGSGRKIRCMGIDASNEVMFARKIQGRLRGRCRVVLIKGGQKANYRGEDVPMKIYLGNLVANVFEDHVIDMPGGPGAKYVGDDFARVKRAGASFEAGVGPSGEHGDTFDAVKLALFGQLPRSGKSTAKATAVGSGIRSRKSVRPGLRDLLKWAGKKISR